MSDRTVHRSWGRLPTKGSSRIVNLNWRHDELPSDSLGQGGLLCHGNGRSYGDSCLNDEGTLLLTRGLDRIIDFDPATGLLECESGLLLQELIELMLPQGWFPPVVPGTQLITIGGAVANDIHGKNHHLASSFGSHIRSLELVRSNGSRLQCSPSEHAELFRATIGGLGLTGFISSVRLQLKSVSGGDIDQEMIPFSNLAEFFTANEDSEKRFEHTVAWVDCAAPASSLGRGILICGNHAEGESTHKARGRSLISVPFTPPISLVNGPSLRLFNELYRQKQTMGSRRTRIHHQPFFFPLDSVRNWNRIYGPRGFYQYQMVIPPESSEAAIGEILHQIKLSGTGSFLAVLKRFGNQEAPGLLSFCRPGTTLALDFPNRGERTTALLDRLDQITLDAGGAVYCAKDARMSGPSFRTYYPQWQELENLRDPAFSSNFWRRVTESPS